jgi:hypothetical protein
MQSVHTYDCIVTKCETVHVTVARSQLCHSSTDSSTFVIWSVSAREACSGAEFVENQCTAITLLKELRANEETTGCFRQFHSILCTY